MKNKNLLISILGAAGSLTAMYSMYTHRYELLQPEMRQYIPTYYACLAALWVGFVLCVYDIVKKRNNDYKRFN